MVFLMLCSAVLALKPWWVEICGILFVMYGSSVISGVCVATERSDMGLHNVPMFMSLFGFELI